MPVDAVIGLDIAFEAVLLKPGATRIAVAAGVDHTADAREIARFEFLHVAADRRDAANDFVARHEGIAAEAPVVARLMEIGMADAAVEDFQHHIIGARGAAGKFKGSQRRLGGLRGIAQHFHGHRHLRLRVSAVFISYTAHR